MSESRRTPTIQAVVGGLFDILVGLGALQALRLEGQLQLEDPLDPFIPRTILTMGLLYALAGIALILPWRAAFHLGRVLLVCGICANLVFAIGAGYYLPRDTIIDHPFLVAAPAFILGLTMLEAIVLFWPEDPE